MAADHDPGIFAQVRDALARNGFDAFTCATLAEARDIVLDRIQADAPKVVSFGDSMTVRRSGLLEALRGLPDAEFIDTFEQGVDRAEIIERRRRALLSDLFVTGSNAVTLNGELVNLDMVGNRVAGLTFGPRRVAVLASAKKIVPDVAAGMRRVKEIAAPANAVRHDFSTPCAKTGRCHDCKSPQRICNTWVITEKCWPKGRIIIGLVEEDAGL